VKESFASYCDSIGKGVELPAQCCVLLNAPQSIRSIRNYLSFKC
jgi:hypothetical protein